MSDIIRVFFRNIRFIFTRAGITNKDIAVICKQRLRARRLHQRADRVPLYQELTVSYQQKKKKLKIAIKTAKRKCWQDFCEEVNSDP